ncbi:hypothetical protein ABG827_13910 [Phocaeicola vulgatus]
MQQTYRYRNIIIKPHWMQFVINELHLLVLISVGFVYAGIDDAVLSTLVFVLSLEKPLNFDPFGHARFAHLFVLYD